MTKPSIRLIASVLTTAVFALGAPAAALAANTNTTIGNDISWPQCGKSLPSGQAFGIVGVNGGTASKPNPCLAQQLVWGNKSTGSVASQPKLQLYINTANPGQIINQVTTWPTFSTPENTYGACDGTNSPACSWQYGWNRSIYAVDLLTAAATTDHITTDPSAYTWWLDVETSNTWETGTSTELAKNAAALEGMTAYYVSRSAKVGLYSTNSQWASIVGTTVTSTSNLNGRDSWLAGSRTLRGAQDRCTTGVALTPGGRVTLSQYVSGSLDYDVPCP